MDVRSRCCGTPEEINTLAQMSWVISYEVSYLTSCPFYLLHIFPGRFCSSPWASTVPVCIADGYNGKWHFLALSHLMPSSTLLEQPFSTLFSCFFCNVSISKYSTSIDIWRCIHLRNSLLTLNYGRWGGNTSQAWRCNRAYISPASSFPRPSNAVTLHSRFNVFFFFNLLPCLHSLVASWDFACLNISLFFAHAWLEIWV